MGYSDIHLITRFEEVCEKGFHYLIICLFLVNFILMVLLIFNGPFNIF